MDEKNNYTESSTETNPNEIRIDIHDHHKSETFNVSSTMAWAAVLIWTGFVFLAQNLGWLDDLILPDWLPENWSRIKSDLWILILLGAGMIMLVEGMIRLAFRTTRRDLGSTFFLAALLIAFGLSRIYEWNIIWPILLIGLGLSMLARGLVNKR